MLRAHALEYAGTWDHNWPLVEFAYNNDHYTSIGIASFQTLSERCCRTPTCWGEAGEREPSKVMGYQSRQKSYADIKRRPLEFNVVDHVFLKVSALKGSIRFCQKGKPSPRFIAALRFYKEQARSHTDWPDRLHYKAYMTHSVYPASKSTNHVIKYEPL